MLRQRTRDVARFKINWFDMGMAIAIGLCCLCAPGTLAQHPVEKKPKQVAIERSNGIFADQAAPAEGRMTEQGIKPKAMRMYRRAVGELHRGQAASAEKDARRAVQQDAKFADADALAATAALAQRQFSRARAEAGDAARINANDEKAWVVLATADNYLAKYTDAVDALSHVRRQNWATWQVAYQRARAEAGLNNAAQALDWANRAALTAPSGLAPLHLLRASALLVANDYSASADELEIYLQLLNPNTPEREELTHELHRLRNMPNSTASQLPTEKVAEYNALAN